MAIFLALKIIASKTWFYSVNMWKKYDDPRPYSTVGGFAVHPDGSFPILHRSNNVRSVRNCWSLPTGNCEIGKSMTDQFATELDEELGLHMTNAAPIPIGWYENISKETDNWWHWIIHIYVVRVDEATSYINREPEKHDNILRVTLPKLKYMMDNGETFAPHHAEFFIQHWNELTAAIKA